MTSDEKRGDAVADQWRERFSKGRRETDLALTELDVRAEQKSMNLEEDSAVIHREALERQNRKDSEPPAKAGVLVIVQTVARKFPPWGAVIVALAALAAYVYLQTR